MGERCSDQQAQILLHARLALGRVTGRSAAVPSQASHWLALPARLTAVKPEAAKIARAAIRWDLNRIRPRAVAQGETYPKLGADTGRCECRSTAPTQPTIPMNKATVAHPTIPEHPTPPRHCL